MLEKEGSNLYENMTKKETQMLNRERVKLADQHRGIKDMKRLPDAIIVVDAQYEDTAIKEARRLKSLDARRRQIQYIGKLLRNIDITEVVNSLDTLNHQSQTFRQHFAKLEQWRDRFINEGNNVIEEFIALYPSADRQQLRNLQRQACREKLLDKASPASEKLFKYIKQLAD